MVITRHFVNDFLGVYIQIFHGMYCMKGIFLSKTTYEPIETTRPGAHIYVNKVGSGVQVQSVTRTNDGSLSTGPLNFRETIIKFQSFH